MPEHKHKTKIKSFIPSFAVREPYCEMSKFHQFVSLLFLILGFYPYSYYVCVSVPQELRLIEFELQFFSFMFGFHTLAFWQSHISLHNWEFRFFPVLGFCYALCTLNFDCGTLTCKGSWQSDMCKSLTLSFLSDFPFFFSDPSTWNVEPYIFKTRRRWQQGNVYSPNSKSMGNRI